MAQQTKAPQTPSESFLGIPMMQGRLQFRKWAETSIEEGGTEEHAYGHAVDMVKHGDVLLHGTFGGFEVYFFNEARYGGWYHESAGVLVIDPAWLRAWRCHALTDAQRVHEWAQELGLQPRYMVQ